MMNIAVLVDSKGQTASLFEAEKIQLYSKKTGKWVTGEEYLFQITMAKGVRALRESLTEAVEVLGDTKVIAGKEITGLAYNILDTAGFSVFEVEGMPGEFLELVVKAVEDNSVFLQQRLEEDRAATRPKQTEVEGNYSINLKELQIHNPEMSSKKALIPFLKKESFYELEVVCGHIPPWFERDFDTMGLQYEFVQTSQNEYRVKVYHKTCGDACSES